MKKIASALRSFNRPRLVADRIEFVRKGNRAVLYSQGRTLEVDIVGDAESAISILEQLRDPDSELWRGDTVSNGASLEKMIEEFDKFGWIQEEILQKNASDFTSDYRALIKDASDWLNTALDFMLLRGENETYNIQQHLLSLSKHTKSLLAFLTEGTINRGELIELYEDGNRTLEGTTLLIVLRSWQRTCPMALVCFSSSLSALVNKRFEDHEMIPDQSIDIALSGIEDVKDIRDKVWTASCLLVQSLTTVYKPQWQKFVGSEIAGDTGTNTAIQAEAMAEAMVAEMDNSKLFSAIHNDAAVKNCAAGIFLHQYFVTIRYLDSISSFLRNQLPEALRRVGYEYLLEEVGHDAHEKDACIKVGLTEDDIAAFSPLPLFYAYPDVLSYFAEIQPVSFCLCVAIAEGLPGQKKMIADALSVKGFSDPDLAVHTELDLELNHSYYPRKLMSKVLWIDASVRYSCFQNFLFTLEMSQFAWRQLANYSEHAVHEVPKAFEMSPAEVISLNV